MIFCPEGIIPDSGLTGPNDIYIYIYIYICVVHTKGILQITLFKISVLNSTIPNLVDEEN